MCPRLPRPWRREHPASFVGWHQRAHGPSRSRSRSRAWSGWREGRMRGRARWRNPGLDGKGEWKGRRTGWAGGVEGKAEWAVSRVALGSGFSALPGCRSGRTGAYWPSPARTGTGRAPFAVVWRRRGGTLHPRRAGSPAAAGTCGGDGRVRVVVSARKGWLRPRVSWGEGGTGGAHLCLKMYWALRGNCRRGGREDSWRPRLSKRRSCTSPPPAEVRAPIISLGPGRGVWVGGA